MQKSKYEVDRVIRSLNKKSDVLIVDKTIYVLSDKAKNRSNDLGNTSLGKIDFLVNYHNFVILRVDEFPKKEYKENNQRRSSDFRDRKDKNKVAIVGTLNI